MLQPVGQKKSDERYGIHIDCPTEERPYFFTNKNSLYKQRNPDFMASLKRVFIREIIW